MTTISIKNVVKDDTIYFADFTNNVTGYIDLDDAHFCSIRIKNGKNFDGSFRFDTYDFKNRRDFSKFLVKHEYKFCDASKFLLDSLNIKNFS